MADAATWKRRTAEWRASGLTAREFAGRGGFAPATLTWWAWRLRSRSDDSAARCDNREASHAVEFARVVRFSAPEPESPVEIDSGSVFDRSVGRPMIKSG